MGASIYIRIAVVAAILYYWWQHPTQIVARSATREEEIPRLEPPSPLDVPLGEPRAPDVLVPNE
jgi:hypothetical protein